MLRYFNCLLAIFVLDFRVFVFKYYLNAKNRKERPPLSGN